MIIRETITINGKEFIKTSSSLGMMIEREEIKYDEAIDLPQMNYTYTETDEPVIKDEDEEKADMRQALNILGVNADE